MRVRAAGLAIGLALACGAAGGTTIARDAHASVSIAVTWDGLLRGSTSAVVAVPVESRSAWESGRIYTYTRVTVERAVAGSLAAGSDAWVRTMGGVVDQIGQVVEGEAVLAPGQRSLLFLHEGPSGSFDVTARGQGQFPILPATVQAPARVVRNTAAGALLAPPVATSSLANRLAADVMQGRPVDDVASDIAGDWGRTHAK